MSRRVWLGVRGRFRDPWGRVSPSSDGTSGGPGLILRLSLEVEDTSSRVLEFPNPEEVVVSRRAVESDPAWESVQVAGLVVLLVEEVTTQEDQQTHDHSHASTAERWEMKFQDVEARRPIHDSLGFHSSVGHFLGG